MYNWNGMKKINYKEAMEQFNSNKEVFLLYEDNTESAVETDINDIHEHHRNNGEFGIEVK